MEEQVNPYKAKYLDQKLVNKALMTEMSEVLKAIDRYRRLYGDPVYVKQFGREVTLDFDDPLYPYCPFRLRKEELLMFKDNAKSKKL